MFLIPKPCGDGLRQYSKTVDIQHKCFLGYYLKWLCSEDLGDLWRPVWVPCSILLLVWILVNKLMGVMAVQPCCSHIEYLLVQLRRLALWLPLGLYISSGGASQKSRALPPVFHRWIFQHRLYRATVENMVLRFLVTFWLKECTFPRCPSVLMGPYP